jgi:hypothetical protein
LDYATLQEEANEELPVSLAGLEDAKAVRHACLVLLHAINADNTLRHRRTLKERKHRFSNSSLI